MIDLKYYCEEVDAFLIKVDFSLFKVTPFQNNLLFPLKF